MRWIIFLLLTINTVFADEREALSYSQKALLSYPEIKQMVKNTEKYILGQFPIDKKYTGPLSAIILSAASGKVNTKPLKMNVELFDVVFEPDAIYNFKTQETITVVNVGWSF